MNKIADIIAELSSPELYGELEKPITISEGDFNPTFKDEKYIPEELLEELK